MQILRYLLFESFEQMFIFFKTHPFPSTVLFSFLRQLGPRAWDSDMREVEETTKDLEHLHEKKYYFVLQMRKN